MESLSKLILALLVRTVALAHDLCRRNEAPGTIASILFLSREVVCVCTLESQLRMSLLLKKLLMVAARVLF